MLQTRNSNGEPIATRSVSDGEVGGEAPYEKVIIYDTTLRDGEQAPGFSMSPLTKLRMAHQLVALGVDVIEAGFPSAGFSEMEAVRAIAIETSGVVVSALARMNRRDVDLAIDAASAADRPRIHVFIAASDIHIRHKLQTTRERILDLVTDTVMHARNRCEDIQVGVEDATRADPDFLCRLVDCAINAGGTTIDLADTVGYAMPSEMAKLVRSVRERVPDSDRAVFSVHCHDDLGLAVANSLAGVEAGARQVDCTINAIGERAGNAALEEFVMALHVRREFWKLRTDVRTRELYATSRLLEQVTGIGVQPNKAIVGGNAFAHEAGIHQHGVLANPLTYEIMTPESVGVPSSRIVLGKHSGRHGLNVWLDRLGFMELSENAREDIFNAFKKLADCKTNVTTQDLRTIISQHLTKTGDSPEFFSERVDAHVPRHASY